MDEIPGTARVRFARRPAAAGLAILALPALVSCSAADSRKYPEMRPVHEIDVDWREDTHYIVRSVPLAEVEDFSREARAKGWTIARVERDPAVPDRLLIAVKGRGGGAVPPERDYSVTQDVPTSGPGMTPDEKHFVKTVPLPDRTARLESR